MNASPRGAIVERTMTNGQQISHRTEYPPGTKENPLDTAEVNQQARELIAPVLGALKSGAADYPSSIGPCSDVIGSHTLFSSFDERCHLVC